jgi:hypothetical protein
MRLRIDGEYLDLYRNEVIAQTFAVNEIGSLETRQGGFSNDFDLPISSKNRRLLGFPDDINSFDRKPYERVEAVLEDGSNNIYGYLRILNVQGKNCTARFLTDNVNWFSLIKDRSIRDLDLSEFDHVYNQANIIASFENTEGYIYPLIDYQGAFRDRLAFEVDVTEMFPSVYVHTIVSQIFKEIGWKIEGELISDPLFNRLVLPFSGEGLSRDTAYISENTTQVFKDTDQAVSGIGSQEINWQGANPDVEISTPTDAYNIELRIGLEVTSGTIATIEVKVDALTAYFGVEAYDAPFSGIVTINITDQIIESGQVITVLVSAFSASATIFASTTSLTVFPVTNAVANYNIQVASTLPDISQEDFMTYLAFAFGIVPQANVLSKTVSFDYFRSISKNLINAINWSSKIDVSNSPAIDFTDLVLPYKSVSIIGYEDDDDDLELVTYKAETNTTFGQGTINIENEHLSGTGTIYESPFAPMINVNSFNNTIYIPQIFGQIPRIGIIALGLEASELTLNNHEILVVTQENEYFMTSNEIPFLWFAKTSYVDSVDSYTDSLAFTQIAFPNVIGKPLIDVYLQDYINILNTPKVLSQRIKLTSVDIAALNFLTPIYIDRFKSYFYLNKINDYQGGITDCELVKISGRILPLIDAGSGDQDYRITDDELLRLLDNGGYRILA